MSPERLQKIEALYHLALERQPGDRKAFLAAACSSDSGLAREVESLLEENSASGPIDRPVMEAVADLLDGEPDSSWPPGTQIGPYRIVALLGEGGMGSVYKAVDSRLGREVAIKTSKDAFTGRFQREARAISALNHPHICTLYDIGPSYIVMELVEGETLLHRLRKGRLSMDLVLRYGAQIADALAAAHAKGITHRDLKPANIMVTRAGIKVLDFGLAKMATAAPVAQADTVTASKTLVGTPAYMSPEQCEGKSCDARTDIFAFGLVLYEMALGKRAFQGESQAALTAEIMRHDPPLGELPPLFAHLVERCLAKDPDNRWQSARDIALQLQYQARDEAAPNQPARWKRPRWLAVAAATILTGIALLLILPRSIDKDTLVAPLTSYPGDETSPSFSPEGSQVAFSWRAAEPGSAYHIYVKQVGPGNPIALTKGASSDSMPRWSPDGQAIAFLRRGPTGDADVYLIPALGGLEHKLAESVGWGCLEWSPDGRWLMVAGGAERPGGWALLSIETRDFVALPRPSDAQPNPIAALAPDGHALAFPVTAGGLMIQPLSSSYQPKGPPRRIPFRPGTISGLAWSADSRDVIFAYGRVGVNFGRAGVGSLWRVPASGAAAPYRLAFALNGGTPAIARRGDRMAFARSAGEINIWSLLLDEQGQAAGPAIKAFDSSRSEFGPAFSHDGTRVAFESDRSGNSEIYVCLIDSSDCSAVTSADGVQVGSPAWSPDGKWIAFDAAPTGTHSEIDIVSSSGGKPHVLVQGMGIVVLPRWSADGHWIYFCRTDPGMGPNIYRIAVSGGAPERITSNGGSTVHASADGKWIYYSIQSVAQSGSLWRLPSSGGQPTEVIHEVAGRNYVPVESGVWYLTPFTRDGSLLQFYDFATGRSRWVSRLPRPPFAGLTLSADGRRILFTQIDQDINSDLMLVENFR